MSDHQISRMDILRNMPLYRWVRKKTWAQELRDAWRLAQMFGPWKALKLSRELWHNPGHFVEVRLPHLDHPIILRTCSSDSRVFYEIFGEKVYDFALPEKASFIIDAGANIGLASVFFAHQYPNAKIIAVEPSDKNLSVLRQNIAHYPHVSSIEAGLWHRKEPLRFLHPNADFWGLRVEVCQPEEANFPSVTLPELLERSGQTRIDILKMDIEGSEQQLLFEGDASWLEQVDLLIIELHGDLAKWRFDEVKKLLAQHGLRLIHGRENCFFRREK